MFAVIGRKNPNTSRTLKKGIRLELFLKILKLFENYAILLTNPLKELLLLLAFNNIIYFILYGIGLQRYSNRKLEFPLNLK